MTSQCPLNTWSYDRQQFPRNLRLQAAYNKSQYAVVMPQSHGSLIKPRAGHRLRESVIKYFGCQSCLRGYDLEDSIDYQNLEENESSTSSQSRTGLQCISCFTRRRRRKKILSLKEALIAEEIFRETRLVDAHPVLDIGLGFTNQELRVNGSRQIIYISHKISKWDMMMKRPGLPSYSYFSGYDEPIVDGYPASIWFDMFEPTLGILYALEKLKHRKTNLTKKRSFIEQLDTLGVPGDVDMDPWGHVFGPNLINIRRILLFPTEELTPSMRMSAHETVIQEFTMALRDLFRTDRKNRSRRTYRPSVRRLKRPMKKIHVFPEWSYDLLYDQSFSSIVDNSSSESELFHDASENMSSGSEKSGACGIRSQNMSSGSEEERGICGIRSQSMSSGSEEETGICGIRWHQEEYKEYYDESFDVEYDENDDVNSDEDLSEEHKRKTTGETTAEFNLQSGRSSNDLCIEDNKHHSKDGVESDKKTEYLISNEDLATHFRGHNQCDGGLHGSFRAGEMDSRSLGGVSRGSNDTVDSVVAVLEGLNPATEHDEIGIFIEEVLSEDNLQAVRVNEVDYNSNNPRDVIQSLSQDCPYQYSVHLNSSTTEQCHSSLYILIPWSSCVAHQCSDSVTWNTNQSADDESFSFYIPDTYLYRQDVGKFERTYTESAVENLKSVKQKWEVYVDQLLEKNRCVDDNNLSYIVEGLKAEPITRRLFLKYVNHRLFVMDESLGIRENPGGNRNTRYSIFSDPEIVPYEGSKNIAAKRIRVVDMFERNAGLRRESAVNYHHDNLLNSAYLYQARIISLSKEQPNNSLSGRHDKDPNRNKCTLPSDSENARCTAWKEGNSNLNGNNEDPLKTTIGENSHKETFSPDEQSTATRNDDPRMLEEDVSRSRNENFSIRMREETVSESAKQKGSQGTRSKNQSDSPSLNRKRSSGRKSDTFNTYSINEPIIRPSRSSPSQHIGDSVDVASSMTPSESEDLEKEYEVEAEENVQGKCGIVILRRKQCRKQDSLETIYDTDDLHESSSCNSYTIYNIPDNCDKSNTSLSSREDVESVDERYPRFVVRGLHRFKQTETFVPNTEMSDDNGDSQLTHEQNSNRNDIISSEGSPNSETYSVFSKRVSTRHFEKYCAIDFGLFSGLQQYRAKKTRNKISKKEDRASSAQKEHGCSSDKHELCLRPLLFAKLHDDDPRLESSSNIGDQSENPVENPYLLALLPLNYQRVRNARQTMRILKGSRNKSLRKIIRRINRTILNSPSRR